MEDEPLHETAIKKLNVCQCFHTWTLESYKIGVACELKTRSIADHKGITPKTILLLILTSIKFAPNHSCFLPTLAHFGATDKFIEFIPFNMTSFRYYTKKSFQYKTFGVFQRENSFKKIDGSNTGEKS
jgi:hypothetical protein